MKIRKHLHVLSSGAPLLAAYISGLSGAAKYKFGVHYTPGLMRCNTDAIATDKPRLTKQIVIVRSDAAVSL